MAAETPKSAAAKRSDEMAAQIAAMGPEELGEFLLLMEAEGHARSAERTEAAAERKEWRRRQN